MTAMTFDTMKLVDALEQADIPRAQARAIVDVVREARDSSDVATKGDLRELEYRIEARLAKVDGELKLHRVLLSTVLGGIMILILKAFF